MSETKTVYVSPFPKGGGTVILPLKHYENMKEMIAHLRDALANETSKRVAAEEKAVQLVDVLEEVVRLSSAIMTLPFGGDAEAYSDAAVAKATEIFNKALAAITPKEAP